MKTIEQKRHIIMMYRKERHEKESLADFCKRHSYPLSLHDKSLDFKDVDLANQTLSSLDFNRVIFMGAILINASLLQVSLLGCSLNGAKLRGSRIKKTLLGKAILSKADLSAAILEDVDFEGAILTEVDFTGATIERALHLKPEQLLWSKIKRVKACPTTEVILAEAGKLQKRQKKEMIVENEAEKEQTWGLINLFVDGIQKKINYIIGRTPITEFSEDLESGESGTSVISSIPEKTPSLSSVFISYARTSQDSLPYDHTNSGYVKIIESDLDKVGVAVYERFEDIEKAQFLLLVVTKFYLEQWSAYKKNENIGDDTYDIFSYIERNHGRPQWLGRIMLVILEEITEDDIEKDLPIFLKLRNQDSSFDASNFEVTSDRHSKYAIAKLHNSLQAVNGNEHQVHTHFKAFLENTVKPFCEGVVKSDNAKAENVSIPLSLPRRNSRRNDIKLEPRNNYFYAMFRLIRNLYGIDLKHGRIEDFRQLRREFFAKLNSRQQSLMNPDDPLTSGISAFSGNPVFHGPVNVTVTGMKMTVEATTPTFSSSASQSTNSEIQKIQLPKTHQLNQGENIMPKFQALKINADKRPSDRDYAVLSNHVYGGSKLKKGDVPKEASDWKVVETQSAGQFFGAIYKHKKTNQVVVAYRGTQSIGDLIEDLRGIFNNNELSPYKEAAFELTQTAIGLAEEAESGLSFTGHSLGGYLAELSVYYCHAYYPQKKAQAVQVARSSAADDDDNDADVDDNVEEAVSEFDVCDSVHAVTFESPGTRDVMEKLQSQLDAGQVNLTQLDITTYLSYPNLVNTCNQHVGTAYSLVPEISSWSNVPGWHLKQVHSMTHIVELFNKAKDHCPERHFMLDWPQGGQRDYYFQNVSLEGNKYVWTRSSEELAKDFKLLVGGRFRIDQRLGDWKILPLRHFDWPLQEWLKRFYKTLQNYSRSESFLNQVKAKWNESGISGDVVNYLLSSALVKERKTNVAYLSIETETAEQTGYFIRRKLSAWLSENGEKAEKILRVFQEIQEQPDIQAELLAAGACLAKEGVIEDPLVQGVFIDIPSDTNPAMLEHFEQVSQHFLQTLKDTGTKVSARLAAPGAVIEGKIIRPIVRAVEFKVGTKPKVDAPQRVQEILLAPSPADTKQTHSPAQLAAQQREREGINQSASSSSSATATSSGTAAINKPTAEEGPLPNPSF
jgi:hypothetical protein